VSDPPVVKLSETCWCGTQVAVEGVDWGEAQAHVTSWRAEHRHRELREADHVGFAAAGFARESGQPAAKARPWAAT
jgi:hypothetical protein